MLYLQATKKALARIGLGREKLPGPGSSQSALGNWFVNVVPMGGREAFLFMSTRSLLSFPILIGRLEPEPHDMQRFLEHGISMFLKSMKAPKLQSTRLIRDLDEIVLCTNADRSLIGVHSAIANDYFQRYEPQRRMPGTDIDSVIARTNSMPRATLEWKNSFEVSTQLLAAMSDRADP